MWTMPAYLTISVANLLDEGISADILNIVKHFIRLDTKTIEYYSKTVF